jgi:integrase
MARTTSFRVGSVKGYLRNHVWYLCYHEQGQRRRPRIGPDREVARQLAAEINGQLATGAPAALSFEPLAIPELRHRWLEHHELVLRSSVQSIERYRTATDHLIRFLDQRPIRHASHLTTAIAEEFVRHLRIIRVSPNGHCNTTKRPLLDKGIRYILECCRALFNYAVKRRHLSPYAENPFATLEIDRIPVETARPVILFTQAEEVAFLKACDDWQFPLFLTLLLTGLRPGELTHLLLPDDLDLESFLIRVRNKPGLGWQVKTRNQRDVPLLPVLARVLQKHVGERKTGPVFRRRRATDETTRLGSLPVTALERELTRRVITAGSSDSRQVGRKLARALWRQIGALDEDRVRVEFIRIAKLAGLAGQTAPKLFRHQFATALQEGRVDPLIRNLLMGHAATGERVAGHGLGMTAVYTHSRPEIVREQLMTAMARRAVVLAAQDRIGVSQSTSPLNQQPEPSAS